MMDKFCKTSGNEIKAKDAVIFVLYRAGFGLMEYRLNPEKAFHKQWVYPGGWCEDKDYSAATAMIRECREELNIQPLDYCLLGPPIVCEDCDIRLSAYLITRWSHYEKYYLTPERVQDTENPVAWREIQEQKMSTNTITAKIAHRVENYFYPVVK